MPINLRHALIPNLKPVPWLEAFSVGDQGIDDDHRTMLLAANGLCLLTGRGASCAVVAEAVAELMALMDRHFANEEALFDELSYPDHARHRAVHVELRHDLSDALQGLGGPDRLGFGRGRPGGEALMACRVAVLAIVEHIIRHDTAYKTFIQVHRGV